MKSEQLPLILLYAVILAILFVFSSFIPTDQEELHHYNTLNFSESWNTAKLAYLHWNPRIGELLSYFLGQNAEKWLILINTISTFVCIISIYRLGTGYWPKADINSILILTFNFITVLGFASGITWFLGNLNWLYPCTCTLVLFCITESFFYGDFQLSWWRTILSIVLAFISGMSNDNTAASAWIMTAGCWIYWSIVKKQGLPTLQYFIILLTLTVACAIFYLAPGIMERTKCSNWEISFSNILWNSLFAKPNWLFFAIMFWRLGAGVLILLIAKKLTLFKIECSRIATLSIAFICLWGILIFAPHWGAPRAYLPMELILACILTHLYCKLICTTSLKKALAVLIMCAAIMATNFVPMIGSLVSSAREWNRIEAMAQHVKSQGMEVLVVHRRDLDFTPALPRLWKMPSSVFDYKVKPIIPLISTTASNATHLNHPHKWIKEIGKLDSGDHIMNPIAAKKLGLKAVYYLSDK